MTSRFSKFLLIALLAAAPLCAVSTQAYAGEGHDDHEHEHEDNDGSGGDDHGSGGNTGSGSGGGSAGGGQSGENSKSENDSDDAQNAVQSGNAVSLNRLLNYVNATYPGTVINVDLKKGTGGYIYHLKLLTEDNKLRIVDLDAKQLKEQNTASLY